MSFQPFRTIGIGVTFSPNLKANIYEAARLAIMLKSKLVLIHVGEKTAESELQFRSIIDPFTEDGLNYDLVFKAGDPVEVILSVSESEHIDLLILGALQRENFFKHYLGSIARKITRQAKCSVLLLIKPSVERIACQHIVVNGLKDPKTQQTIASAFYVANSLGADKMTIVEEINQNELAITIEDDKTLKMATIVKKQIKLREEARIKTIIEDIPKTHTENIIIKSQPIFGKKGYSIGHYAEVVRADLLVMNAPTKMTFWDRVFPHDIEHILSEIPTDVLIIQ